MLEQNTLETTSVTETKAEEKPTPTTHVVELPTKGPHKARITTNGIISLIAIIMLFAVTIAAIVEVFQPIHYVGSSSGNHLTAGLFDWKGTSPKNYVFDLSGILLCVFGGLAIILQVAAWVLRKRYQPLGKKWSHTFTLIPAILIALFCVTMIIGVSDVGMWIFQNSLYNPISVNDGKSDYTNGGEAAIVILSIILVATALLWVLFILIDRKIIKVKTKTVQEVKL